MGQFYPRSWLEETVQTLNPYREAYVEEPRWRRILFLFYCAGRKWKVGGRGFVMRDGPHGHQRGMEAHEWVEWVRTLGMLDGLEMAGTPIRAMLEDYIPAYEAELQERAAASA